MRWRTRREVLVTLFFFFFFSIPHVSGFRDDPPKYNYDKLPKTQFTCKDKIAGRYYADPETECQMFHVCVRMSPKQLSDFKFLCPNGTTFDQEHQVCMDYYQVVCHQEIGTNPLGHIYEILKLSSLPKNSGLDMDKISFIDPDVAERNTLGDDFQVQEYNNNRAVTVQQNSLNDASSERKHVKDFAFKKVQATTVTTTTAKPTPTVSTTTTTQESITKKKPNLETYESYEIESVNGFQNTFNRLKHYDYSFESFDPLPESTSTTTTTTYRPLIFHNTFRSPLPSTPLPPPTFQQQASRFNEDFFRKITTEKPTSKAAQFYLNSNLNTKFSTPEVRQPVTYPFKSTTEIPFVKFSPQVGALPGIGVTVRGLSNRKIDGTLELRRVNVNNGTNTRTDEIIRGRSVSSGSNNVNHLPTVLPPTTAEPTTYFHNLSSTTTFSRPYEHFGLKEGVTPTPKRRGTRRRVNRPKLSQTPRKFDPELKYSRRKIVDTKDEIFKAEASVFPGKVVPNFFEEDKQKDQQPEPVNTTTESIPKIAASFGRKINPNTARQQHQFVTEATPSGTTTDSPKPTRKVIKRIKAKTKTTTLAPLTSTSTTTTTTVPPTTEQDTTTPTELPTSTEDILLSVSTLRPVKKISVKTKMKLKDFEIRIPPGTIPIKSTTFEKLKKYVTQTITTTTTQVPELVSSKTTTVAPFDEFKTTWNPVNTGNSSTSVVVKVTSTKDAIPTPISFKEPILPNFMSRVEIHSSIREEEGSTRSPDYDYAYYNTDDDYTDAASKLLLDNIKTTYGKKPVKKSNPSQA